MNFKKIKLKDKIEVHDPFLQINKNDFQNLNIKKELNKNKVILFENIFKFESKIETPTQFELLKEKDWHVPVSKMITICKNLNLSIVSYKSEHNNSPFVNIVKMNIEDEIKNIKSKKFMRGHTDGSSHRFPNETHLNNVSISPDFIILTCLRNNNTSTKISFVSEIVKDLTYKEKLILSKPQFISKPQLSYEKWLNPIYPVSVLHNNFSEIRFSHSKIEAINNKEANIVLEKLKSIIEKKTFDITLKSGDILFINNKKCLHGRGNPGNCIVPEDRWLIRSYGMKNENLINGNTNLI